MKAILQAAFGKYLYIGFQLFSIYMGPLYLQCTSPSGWHLLKHLSISFTIYLVFIFQIDCILENVDSLKFGILIGINY